MITGITLENFKGFHEVEFQPKRITAFVGPNGTGKSSVLQAFGLLKQTVGKPDASRSVAEPRAWEGEIVTQGPLVNLPNVEALASNVRRGRGYPPNSRNVRSLHPMLGFEGFRGIRQESLRFSCKAMFSHTLRINVETTSRVGIRTIISTVKMVLAVRALAQPVYGLEEDLVEDIFSIADTGRQEAQTATNLAYSHTGLEKVSYALEKVTGAGLRVDTVPSKAVEVKSLSKVGPISIVGDGFGTNSLIMLLLQLVSAERGATVMIEEPEIHLHPKAQADLAEVLAEEALAGDKQVIMTTHSEHILNRLLTLVVEGKLSLDDLAIYAFEKDAVTGVCSAKSLKIGEDGRVEGGIKDFFAVNLAEMNRYVEAQFARMQVSK